MANRFLNNIRINDAYTFPASDGNDGQVITTDGAGNLAFENVSPDAASVIYRDNFTGDGSTVTFDLQNSITDEDQTQIYIDGVYQEKSTYSISGTTITFTTAPISGHSVEVISISSINTGPTVLYQDNFTGNGSDTAFTLGQIIDNEIKTFIFLNGVYQFKNTYTVDGTTLTFDTAPANGVAIEVVSIASAVQSDSLEAGSVIIPVKNTHTASIAKGTPVYITGNVGASERLQIAPADASNSAKMPAAGLLLTTLAVNEEGYVITGGYLRNLTTDTIDSTSTSSNDTVYVKAGGGLTMTKPTGSNLIQNIAKIARSASGSSGSLIVSSILRTNDIPNLTTGKIWVGDSNTVESTVIHLDESNNRLGINNNSPSYSLDVTGDANISSNVIIGGNLTVDGTQTILNTQTVEVEDNILQLNTTQGSPDTATATTSGISIYRGDGVTQASFIFDDADDTWDLTNNLTVNGNLNLADDEGIRLGNSNDLQIYHDSTSNNSFIKETGAGSLQIWCKDFEVYNAGGTETLINADVNAGVQLYYNNVVKFATTSTGVTFSNLSNTSAASSSVDEVKIGTFGAGRPAIFLGTSNTTYSNSTWFIENIGSAGKLRFGRNGKDIMEIFNDGDIYMSDNLGIGETSPSTKVEIKQTNNDIYQLTLYNNNISTTSKARIGNWNDDIKISSNYMQSGGTKTQDNTAKSSWVMSMGAAGDAFDISRSPAASTTLSSLMKIDSSGNVGINETDPSGYWGQANNIVIDTSGNGGITIKSTSAGNGRLVFTDTKSTTAGNTDGGMIHYKHSDDEMRFQTNGSQKMVIDSSGNVGINETNPDKPLHLSGSSGTAQIKIQRANTNTTGSVGSIGFANDDGYFLTAIETQGDGNDEGAHLIFRTHSDAVSTDDNPYDVTERMRITSDGEVLINKESARGSEYLGIESSGNEFCNFQKTGGARAFRVNCTDSEGFNTSGTTIFVGKNGTTNRSINAGGTINASGADYAEYMNKAIEEDISKGDIVGINSNGELTNIFNDSVSFVVKSTNPSYVGGDTWGVNLEGDALEEARLKVDRIAFSGQVPCNVYGASVGDYIIPINNNGKISAQAISNPTFDEYKLSVGKVWKIMEDGRAWIAVKIV